MILGLSIFSLERKQLKFIFEPGCTDDLFTLEAVKQVFEQRYKEKAAYKKKDILEVDIRDHYQADYPNEIVRRFKEIEDKC
jgi:hypothetical protein